MVSLQPLRTAASVDEAYLETTLVDELPLRALRSDPLPQDVPGQPDVRTWAGADPRRTAIEAAAAQLRGRAFLYDDPDAYAAGVRDALSELNERLQAASQPAPPFGNPHG